MPSTLHGSLPLDPSRKEIRLLKIHPRKWDDEIYMDLYVASLNDDPQYSALSYVWGEPDPKTQHRAWVNGHDVPIAANLFLALRRLRAHAGNTGLIYSGCKEGLVWFGELEARLGWEVRDCWYFAGDDSDFSSEIWTRFLSSFGVEDFDPTIPDDILVRQLVRAPIDKTRIAGLQDLDGTESLFHFAWFLRQLQGHSSQKSHGHLRVALPYDLTVILEEVEGNWRGYWSRTRGFLGLIASDPWFRRLWVVQELVLPREIRVFFGPISMPLYTFSMALYWLPNANVLIWEADKTFEDHRLLDTLLRYYDEITILRMRRNMERRSIVAIRLNTLYRDASVDHDQAYAVLAMSSSALEPNYRGGPVVAYTQLCRETMLKERKLKLLSFSGVKNRYQDMPSWSVDWTMLQTDPKRRTWYEMWHSYLLSNSAYFPHEADLQTNLTVEGNVLCVDGAEMDSVKELLPTHFSASGRVSRPSHNESAVGVYDETTRYLACPRFPTDPYPGGWLWGEIWLRTLCLDLEWKPTLLNRFSEKLEEGMGALLIFSGYEEIEMRKYVVSSNEDMDVNVIISPEHIRKEVFLVKGKTASRAETSTSPHWWPTLRDEWENLRDSIETRMFEHKLFLTEKGFLGCGNENVAVGDKVFLLPGTTVPTILQHSKEGGTEAADHFRLVSDAFILGLMDTETWLGSLEHLRRIRIR